MPAGRPTRYKKEYAEQAYKLCLLGFTDRELSEFFSIAESTLNLWKKKHKEFSESLTRGKDIADAEVALSFFKRATGYKYDEVHQELKKDPEGNKYKLTVSKVVTKEVVPDTGAGLSWLKNRQSKKWRDKVDQEHSGELKIRVIRKSKDKKA